MATPGPTFWQQIEADERRRHATDRANARAFIAKRFEPILQKAGVKFVIDVTRGDTNNWSVGEIVCNHAKMLKATTVVMAPHGKGRMKEFFVGSVCNHCLHRCEAPLVMVRPERMDAAVRRRKPPIRLLYRPRRVRRKPLTVPSGVRSRTATGGRLWG